jgi:two-component system NarL family sensor kinase
VGWVAVPPLGSPGRCVRSRWRPSPLAFQVLNASTPTAAPRGPAGLAVGFVLLFMSFATVGALIASPQPGNLIGWIFCTLSILGPFGFASEEYALYTLVTKPDSLPGGEVIVWLAAWFGGPIIFAVLAFILFLFPDGRLLSRRWRPVVWANLVAILLLFAWNFEPGQIENLGLLNVPNPFGVAGADALLNTLGTIGLFLVLAARWCQLLRCFRCGTGFVVAPSFPRD